MKTEDIAGYMRSTGKFYTATTLSLELKVALAVANSALYNIREGEKYVTTIQGEPNPMVRVTSIKKPKKKDLSSKALWDTALNRRTAA